jgi:PTS system N-acetylglucosamine-specific IIC component
VFWFFVYFLVFRFVILRFKLKTPGREDDEELPAAEASGSADERYLATAGRFLTALGGKENVLELENCATRLRMELADVARADEAALKRAGAAGTMKPGGRSFQVIYGTNVQFVKDAMEQIISGQAEAPADVPPAPTAVVSQTATKTAAPVRVVLRQPLAGRVVALSEVPDPTFAEGIMGPGIAIDPTGDTVVAPADATVGHVFETGHAVALVLEDGTELLIHVGIDTVAMKGDGFQTLVSAGDAITAGTPLLRFDRAKIEAAGHPVITPVIVLNNEDAVIELS